MALNSYAAPPFLDAIRSKDPLLYAALEAVVNGINQASRRIKIGRAALKNGRVTVPEKDMMPTSNVFVTVSSLSGTPGTLTVPLASKVVGSFVITSTSATDNSTVDYAVVNP